MCDIVVFPNVPGAVPCCQALGAQQAQVAVRSIVKQTLGDHAMTS
jgi:hypothetical protein